MKLVKLFCIRFLKPGGIMLPSSCYLYLAGCSDIIAHNERINCSVLGYRMKPMQRYSLMEPAIERVKAEKIMTIPAMIRKVDLLDFEAVNSENCCNFTSEFSLKVYILHLNPHKHVHKNNFNYINLQFS